MTDKFVVQVKNNVEGWIETRHGANNKVAVFFMMKELLKDDDAWMPEDYPRQARVWNTQLNLQAYEDDES